jgi:hypothetical protein
VTDNEILWVEKRTKLRGRSVELADGKDGGREEVNADDKAPRVHRRFARVVAAGVVEGLVPLLVSLRNLAEGQVLVTGIRVNEKLFVTCLMRSQIELIVEAMFERLRRVAEARRRWRRRRILSQLLFLEQSWETRPRRDKIVGDDRRLESSPRRTCWGGA